MFPNGLKRRSRATGHPPGGSYRMSVLRHIAAECMVDRVFAVMIVALGSWSAISCALLALNALDLFAAS